MRRIAGFAIVLLLVAIGALAQSSGEENQTNENGFLANLLQDTLSGPGRQIEISDVSGLLSSQARIGLLTVSDNAGAWLRLEGVELDWTRASLLLGNVNVNRLSAERVEWIRKGEAPPDKPSFEADTNPFTLPELPVSIHVKDLNIPSLVFDEAVFGEKAELEIAGALALVKGALSTKLNVRRKDGPGGKLDVSAAFANETRQLDLDIHYQEPQGGLVAGLLKIEGEPEIDLRLVGSGPLEKVDVDFYLDAGGDRIAGGKIALRESDVGLAFAANFSGGLSPLIPQDFRDFFAGQSTVQFQGITIKGGGLRLEKLSLAGAELDLQGRLDLAPDWFPRNLSLTGTLGDPAGDAITLPVPGADTRLQSAEIYISYGNATRWNGLLVLDRLEAGGLEIEDITFDMGGLAQNLDDPTRRNVTISLEGLATGIWTENDGLASALGTRLDLFADARLPPGAPVEVRQLQLSGNGLSVFSAGSLEGLNYTGRNAVRISDLSQFSDLLGRELGGSMKVRTDGSASLAGGAFDLTLDGSAQDVKLGDARLDGILAGASTLAGHIVRDESGIRTEGLKFASPQIQFDSDGLISTERTDIDFNASLTDLAAIDPRASGALSASGTAVGSGLKIDVALQADIPEGRVLDSELKDITLGVTGQIDGSDVSGHARGGGAIAGLPANLEGTFSVAGQDFSVSDLDVAVGSNSLTGGLSKTGSDPFNGNLVLNAPDIAPLAALALLDATGSIEAEVELAPDGADQLVTITGDTNGLSLGENSIGSAQIDARIRDALGKPMVEGTLDVTGLAVSGVNVSSLTARAEQQDADRMDFTAHGRLEIGTLADVSGSLERMEQGLAVTLDALRVRHESASAELTEPATVTLKDGELDLTPLTLDLGGGGLTAEGSLGETIDLKLDVTELPLSLADTVMPQLGMAGVLNGTARVTGSKTDPDIRFDVTAEGVSAAGLKDAGVPPLSLDATGKTSGGRLDLDGNVSAQGGLASSVRGSVPLGEGDLDLAVDLQAFPLVLIDRVAGGQGLEGQITGKASVSGPITNPAASFSLRGTGLGATVMRANGVEPLALEAEGSFEDMTLTLESAKATGQAGMSVLASGTLPLTGPGLDFKVTGALPLEVADAALAFRDAQATGLMNVEVDLSGSLASLQYGGSVSLSGVTIVDPQTNIRLEEVALNASLKGDSIVISEFRAKASSGGTISASGTVSLDGASGNPADMKLVIDRVRYTDGTFVTTEISGNLALKGPLQGGGGLLSGQIDLGQTEISVAEGLGAGAGAALEEVAHKHTPAGVQVTLDRAKAGEPSPAKGSGQSGLALDILIRAPRQIFVRGRGLDVELHGELTIRGTTDDIEPVGEFDMRRGRLNLLGHRLEFTKGSMRLIGDLDPELDFEARTKSDDVTAIASVTGRASDPEIKFTSEPELPEDEVLARILFNRSAADLSAFQLAQLAAGAAEMAGGGGGPGILEKLRGATGLDDLDVITNEDGSTAVSAGRYISDEVYLDVQTGSDGISRAEVNLDINDKITARGSVATDGNTTLGIFYERDY